MLTALIVENDAEDALALTEALREISREVKVAGVCANVSDAVREIARLKPQLLFLDIELEGYETGFDLLRMYEKLPFGVIFISQFNTFNNAVRAWRASAMDFLEKPVQAPALEAAIDIYLRKTAAQQQEQFEVMKDVLQREGNPLLEVCVPNTEGQTRLEISSILYCEAANSSTRFHLAAPIVKKPTKELPSDVSQPIIVSAKTLKYWEQTLDGCDMCRIHRSYLVNLKWTVRYKDDGDGAQLLLKNGEQLRVSRDKKAEVKQRWKAYCKS